MKKVLLSVCLCSLTAFSFAQEQVILTENFETLTVGNVGADLTGAAAGQGGWKIYGGTGATVSEFQIVNITTAQGKSAQLTSGPGYAATSNPNNRFMFKDISATATPANNILVGSLKIYTGPATGAGRFQGSIYDANNGIVGIAFDYATKQMKGMGTMIQVAPPAPALPNTRYFFTFNLGTQAFAANTWVTADYSYNKTTGAFTWSYTDGTTANTGSYQLAAAPAGYTLIPALSPTEFDLVNSTLTGNTVANVAAADDIVVKFSNAALLNVHDVKDAILNDNITIYPNPASEILYIGTKERVNSVSIYDMSGRKINVKAINNEVDVRSLQSGTYIIDVETSKSKSSQKFIKK